MDEEIEKIEDKESRQLFRQEVRERAQTMKVW